MTNYEYLYVEMQVSLLTRCVTQVADDKRVKKGNFQLTDLLNEYGSKGWKMVSQMKHDSEADFEIALMTTFMREAQ